MGTKNTNSDRGGGVKDRRSASGGAWLLGDHRIKTWSSTQGAFALSSAEAELYAMVEGATRARGMITLAGELGFTSLGSIITLGTDSSAAKSFVNRRGVGRMRHLAIRDLWLQREIREGRLETVKVLGTENPADLMTKALSLRDIGTRLKALSMEAEFGENVFGKKVTFADGAGDST